MTTNLLLHITLKLWKFLVFWDPLVILIIKLGILFTCNYNFFTRFKSSSSPQVPVYFACVLCALPECGSSLCRCLESWARIVSLCAASSIPTSFSSPSVTFSKPCREGEPERNKAKLGIVRIWAKNKRQIKKPTGWHIYFSYICIPPNHNIHSLVVWCTGAGQSVSATRRWNDYSCLNSKGRKDTDYISAHMLTHMLVLVFVHECLKEHICLL